MKSLTIILSLLLLINAQLFSHEKRETDTIFRKYTHIKNVEIFDGKNEKTTKRNILIVENIIRKITNKEIDIQDTIVISDTSMVNDTLFIKDTIIIKDTLIVIDGKGKFLMPGLIDAHVHLLLESPEYKTALLSDYAMLNFIAAKASKQQLLRGFTTVRDMGGGALTIAHAIDKGLVIGPRVYASGAFISQTGGHGDFGLPTDVPRTIGELSYPERNGIMAIADGADQVLMRTREQLRQGATQIKLMAGGGVSSNYDPLDVTQYTPAEFKAAVSAAKNWGTYVTVHAYAERPIKMAINSGVKCIEHGQLANNSTAQLMADKGIWWSLQPFLDDEFANPKEGENRVKQKLVSDGTKKAYSLAVEYDIKTAWGTDIMFSSKLASKQGAQLAKMIDFRSTTDSSLLFSAYDLLKMATSTNAKLLGLSGERNPYKEGKLGEISVGAYADLIIVDGSPLEDIRLIAKPDKNFLLVMKDGTIYKNIMDQ